MRQRIAKDIWMALRIAGRNIVMSTLYFIVISIALTMLTKHPKILHACILLYLLIVPTMSLIMYLSNSTYEVTKDGYVIFPRSDVENSIFQILIYATYWNLMRRQKVHISEIENLYIDSQVEYGYNLNVVGSYGSSRFEFSSAQKRNEVMNMISQAHKEFYNQHKDYNNINNDISNTINLNY